MEACGCDYCKDILEMKDWLVKKSQWIIGGDGWGYDIGFGGVDPVSYTHLDVYKRQVERRAVCQQALPGLCDLDVGGYYEGWLCHFFAL